MSTARQIVIIALLCVAGIGVYGFVAPFLLPGSASTSPGKETGTQRTGLPVIVAPVRIAENDAVVRAVGSGKAQRTVTIHPSAAGEVVEVAFESGEHVGSGDVLVRLDDEAERLAVRLAAARAEEAKQMLQRYARARPTGAVSAAQLDTARAAVEQARIELEQARVTLEDKTIRAPFAGVVGLPLVEVGDRVSETTEITMLDDRSTLLIDFEIPEAYAGRVSVGDEISASTRAVPGKSYTGTIVALGSRIDPVTRTLTVRAAVPNPDERLRTGMSFAVMLRVDGSPFPSVPEVAVQWGREGAHIWIVRGGAAERVQVALRQRRDGRVLLEGEVREGEPVVVEGVQRLRPGVEVDADTVADEAASVGPLVGEGT